MRLLGGSSQTGRVRFFMCIVLSRVLLSLACSLGCISLFFGLVFIWRPWRPLIGRAKSLKLTHDDIADVCSALFACCVCFLFGTLWRDGIHVPRRAVFVRDPRRVQVVILTFRGTKWRIMTMAANDNPIVFIPPTLFIHIGFL